MTNISFNNKNNKDDEVRDEVARKVTSISQSDDDTVSEWLANFFDNKENRRYEREGNRLYLLLQNRLKGKITESYLLSKADRIRQAAENIKSEYKE